MKLDNRRIQRIVQRMMLLILIMFVSSVFLTRYLYQTFEGKSITYFQSILFVVQTYTTTGYGELLPFETGMMNLYASLQMILGTGLILIGLATAAAAWMQSHFQELPATKVSAKLKDHMIICGYSPLADSLLDELIIQQMPYVIVEKRHGTVRELMQQGLNVIQGDPSEQQMLEAAGIRQARALIASSTDDTNVHIVLEARSLSSLPILVAVENELQQEALELAGATEIVAPKRILGEELARVATSSLGKELVADIDQLGDLLVMEFPIGMYCQYANQTLQQSRIRENTGTTILGLWENGVFRFVDSPHMVLSEESMVVVLGTREQLQQLDDSLSSHLYSPGDNRHRFVVAGYGDVAKRTVELLSKQGNEVRLIVNQPVPAHSHVSGDMTSRAVLLEAGIDKAGTYIISAPTDEQAIFSTLMARKINPRLRIYVRANSHTNVKKLYRAGADFVLSVSKISGNIISRLLTTGPGDVIPDVDIQFFQHQVGEELDLTTIQEATILKSSGCMIIAIKKEGTILQNPPAATLLCTGDILVLLAQGDGREKFKRAVQSAREPA
ncbi:NAD-binding protein [Anoxynatronum sibiricum]|uniref:NAD-binding protein n=1 Tax=Anoxynatronum sibiricum TaxID=210623 RepID=A0ABU9VV49_9CLOT